MKNMMEQDIQKAAEKIEKLSYIINEYADERGLKNTKRILKTATELLYEQKCKDYKLKNSAVIHFKHSLEVCKMLIDLVLPLTDEETDVLLAGELGHVLCEIVHFPEDGRELCSRYGVDPEVTRVSMLMSKKQMADGLTEDEYYENIKKDKLALIIRLAEIGILTEQFYMISISRIDDYMRRVREYFFPMCIYAKEIHPELAMSISVLMEKVKLLMEVTEILSKNYRNREVALINEMLVLQEENARLRTSIKELTEEA